MISTLIYVSIVRRRWQQHQGPLRANPDLWGRAPWNVSVSFTAVYDYLLSWFFYRPT